MNENITLTKTALVNLLDAVPYPNPDDPWGQYGTIGPVAQALRDLSWVLLNRSHSHPELALTLIPSAMDQDRSPGMLRSFRAR